MNILSFNKTRDTISLHKYACIKMQMCIKQSIDLNIS